MTWPVQLITAVSPEAALQSLAYTLPALLRRKEWSRLGEPISRRLIKLVNDSASPQQQSVLDRHRKPERPDGLSQHARAASAHDISSIAAACLVGVREHLADDAWHHVPDVLNCLRQS